MLAAAQRLRRRDEFAAVIRGGRRASRGSLVIHLRQRPSTPVVTTLDDPPATARAGFVVPKAVGAAVVRNLVRRRLRHALRDRLAELPTGVDVVVRVLPAAAGRSYPELVHDLDEALRAASGKGRRR